MKKIGLAIMLMLMTTVPVASAGWLQVADCEADEAWTAKWQSDGSTVSGDALYHVEGEQGIRLTCTTRGRNMRAGTARLEFDPPRDLSAGDYVYLAYYLPSTANAIYLRYWTGNGSYLGMVYEDSPGWHFIERPKSAFIPAWSPNWSQIDAVELYITFLCNAEETWITFDDWRHVYPAEESYIYLPVLFK